MKYIVNIFLNGIHWDNSYTNNNSEAIDYKNYVENNNFSIWDKINGNALEDFIKKYNIKNPEDIIITAKIKIVKTNMMYELLKNHIGHNIVCVAYGDINDPDDICIECEDCNEVLISAETFEDED